MLVTIGKLNLEFNEDIEALKCDISELEKLIQAIKNSPHFALLAGKTQMLGKGKGITKKERSREIHTNTIAYGVVKPTISLVYDRVLEEKPALASTEYSEMFELNKKYAMLRGEAMALAHDLGHVACGHQGERALNSFLSNIGDSNEIKTILDEHRRFFGEDYEKQQGHIDDDTLLDILPVNKKELGLSFEHNELSALILNQIIEREGLSFSNSEEVSSLTLGVLGHSTSRTSVDLLENDLPAQIVRVADKVEYINIDFDEIYSLINIPNPLEEGISSYLQKTSSDRIKQTTYDLTEDAIRLGKISEKNLTMRRLSRMRELYEDIIIYSYEGRYSNAILRELLEIADKPEQLAKYYSSHKGTEALYPPELLETLKSDLVILKNSKDYSQHTVDDAYQNISGQRVYFKSIMQGENSDRIFLLYQRILDYYYKNPDKIPTQITRTVNPIDITQTRQISYTLNSEQSIVQRLLEYVSLMDDEEMIRQYESLVEERIENGPNYGIEPIRMDEIKTFLYFDYEAGIDSFKRKEGLDTRSEGEIKNLFNQRNKEFFTTRLTTKGKEAMRKYYQIRFAEYDKDFQYLQRMISADEERAKVAGEEEKIQTETHNIEPVASPVGEQPLTDQTFPTVFGTKPPSEKIPYDD